jgi:hypothetical protein
MPTINQLPLLASPAPGDQVPVYSTENGDARRLPLSELATFIESIIEPLEFGDGLQDDSVANRILPQVAKSSNYTLVASDSGKHVLTTAIGLTLTIPSSLEVPWPIGTVLTFVNSAAGNISIAITADTMTLAGTTTTGTRTLAQNGRAEALKIGVGVWIISGVGLT